MRQRNLSSFVRTNTPFANIVKSVNETVASSTTVQDDNELFVNLRANKLYNFSLILFCGGIAGDIKYTFEDITNATRDVFTNSDEDATATLNFGVEKDIPLISSSDLINMKGSVQMGSTKGTLQFQWAQRISSATETTVFLGSMLTVWESK